jgi:hypothetical protein
LAPGSYIADILDNAASIERILSLNHEPAAKYVNAIPLNLTPL